MTDNADARHKAIQRRLDATKKEARAVSDEYAKLGEIMERLKSTQGIAQRRVWNVEFNRFSRRVDVVDVRFQSLRRKLETVRHLLLSSESEDNKVLAAELDTQIFALVDGAHSLIIRSIKDK